MFLYEKSGDTDDTENLFLLFSSLMTLFNEFSFSTKLDVNGCGSLDVDDSLLNLIEDIDLQW